MTAVVRFQTCDEQFPVLLGDLLLAGPRSIVETTQFPTIEDASLVFPKEAEYVVCGMRQKLAVIGGKLAIGWSGNYCEAKDALSYLWNAERNGTLTFDCMEDYLQSQGNSGPSYLGFFLESDGFVRFGYRYESLPTTALGQVGFIGVGSDALETRLREIGGPKSTADEAVSLAMVMAGSLLAEEVIRGTGFIEYFGGGYEIACVHENRFQKLDDVAYAFWLATIQKDGTVGFQLIHLCAYGYSDDVLTVRSVSVYCRDNSLRCRHWLSHVAPIYRHAPQSELNRCDPPALNTKWLCNFFIVTNVDEGVPVFCRVDCRATTLEKCLHFQEVDTGIQIGFEQSFLRSVGDDILSEASLFSWSLQDKLGKKHCCIRCGIDIPPGRQGRMCKNCRKR